MRSNLSPKARSILNLIKNFFIASIGISFVSAFITQNPYSVIALIILVVIYIPLWYLTDYKVETSNPPRPLLPNEYVISNDKPRSELLIGRKDEEEKLRKKLGISRADETSYQARVALWGTMGVGKTGVYPIVETTKKLFLR